MRICQHCGARKRADDPLLECWIYGERYLLHRGAGCDDYVPKPYSPRQLLAKIRRYLP